MQKKLSNLLTKAIAAKPMPGSGKWAHLMEPVAILLRNGFNLTKAVVWLQEQGAVPLDEKSRRSAYYSIAARLRREKTPA